MSLIHWTAMSLNHSDDYLAHQQQRNRNDKFNRPWLVLDVCFNSGKMNADWWAIQLWMSLMKRLFTDFFFHFSLFFSSFLAATNRESNRPKIYFFVFGSIFIMENISIAICHSLSFLKWILTSHCFFLLNEHMSVFRSNLLIFKILNIPLASLKIFKNCRSSYLFKRLYRLQIMMNSINLRKQKTIFLLWIGNYKVKSKLKKEKVNFERSTRTLSIVSILLHFFFFSLFRLLFSFSIVNNKRREKM